MLQVGVELDRPFVVKMSVKLLDKQVQYPVVAVLRHRFHRFVAEVYLQNFVTHGIAKVPDTLLVVFSLDDVFQSDDGLHLCFGDLTAW